MDALKRTGASIKPSRTLFVGPLSRYCLVFSGSLLALMASSMKKTLDDERRAWKKLHGHGRSVNFTGEQIDEDTVVGQVDRIICPNFLAFQERLAYFENNLNGLLYSRFVPMDVIRSLFVSRFHGSIYGGRASFLRPEKCYFYADVAAIVAIVHLVTVFTRYESQKVSFVHPLAVDPHDLSSLALKLLNISEYRRKKTQLALITLILLRSGLYIHDNSEGTNEEFNSYPVFQASVDLCYQMGLHRSPDSIKPLMFKDKITMKARAMSSAEKKELWNFILEEDAAYSVTVGTPLLVSTDFCAGFKRNSNSQFDNMRQDGVMLLRELSITINSLKPICIRDVVKLLEKVISYCSKLPFEMFSTKQVQSQDRDQLARLFKLKLLFLQVLQCLCRIVILGIGEVYKSGSSSYALDSRETASMLNSLCQEMYVESLLAAASSLFIIRDVCAGRSVFGEEKDGKYIIFFRDIFDHGLAQAFVLWFSYLLSMVTKNPEIITELHGGSLLSGYPPDSVLEEEINVYSLETALYRKYTGTKDSIYCERMSRKLVSLPTLITFASSLYDAVSQNEVMRLPLDSFMTLKVVIIFLYVLQTIEECKDEPAGLKMTVSDIMIKVKQKVELGFNLGRLDEKLKLNVDDYELQKLLDSVLTGWPDVSELGEISGVSIE
ncbi:DEKNAAC103791 [Brettanomyces naardenensis]|uniref:DEKNAAC103791 n=1 Tax=Brettanomyces naardenensis TaxID=13370 RepID=A0A448YPB7_BRENA|nr:DEKNAAC103791 [Brettanomyces naardenensis]